MRHSVTGRWWLTVFVEGRGQAAWVKSSARPTLIRINMLVGAFVDKHEDAYQACTFGKSRGEVGLEIPLEKVEQLMTVSTPGRDPRGWVITIAHLVTSAGHSSRSNYKLAMMPGSHLSYDEL